MTFHKCKCSIRKRLKDLCWDFFIVNVNSKCTTVRKMMNASCCEDSAMRSWKDLVKVNGSFYCNLSLNSAEPELDPSQLAKTLDATEHRVFRHSDWVSKNEPIYVNSHSDASVRLSNGTNRTILRIGDEMLRQPCPVEYAESNDFPTPSGPSCHTIKLVIGEPLSLDTSEYVSWDGSQIGAQSAVSADEDDHIGHNDDDDDDDSGSDQIHLQADELPPLSPTSSLRRESIVDDELTHSCCRFFDQRQQKLSSFVSTTWNPTSTPEAATLAADSVVKSPVPGLNAKMEHLRMEIVSLISLFSSSVLCCRSSPLSSNICARQMTFPKIPNRMLVKGSNLCFSVWCCRKPKDQILRRNQYRAKTLYGLLICACPFVFV